LDAPFRTQSSADPVDLGAQGDLISARELVSIEAVLAAPNGGHWRTGPTSAVY
jgi:hypothetical protein